MSHIVYFLIKSLLPSGKFSQHLLIPCWRSARCSPNSSCLITTCANNQVIEMLAPCSSGYLQGTRKFRQGFSEAKAKSAAFLMPEPLPSTICLTAKTSSWRNTHFRFTFHLWKVVTRQAPSKVELQCLPGALRLGYLAGEVDKTSDGISWEQWPGNPSKSSWLFIHSPAKAEIQCKIAARNRRLDEGEVSGNFLALSKVWRLLTEYLYSEMPHGQELCGVSHLGCPVQTMLTSETRALHLLQRWWGKPGRSMKDLVMPIS